VSIRSFRATLIALVLALALALPAAASAQVTDPSATQYGETGQQVEEQVAVGGSGGGNAPSGGGGGGVLGDRVVGSLPFTGFDLVAMAFAAAAVMGTGFALRRFSRPPQAGE
jgi:hypothetical protein